MVLPRGFDDDQLRELRDSLLRLTDAHAIILAAARLLSETVEGRTTVVCIYRDHPALEISVAAAARNGCNLDTDGLAARFAGGAPAFDRWRVRAAHQDRWKTVAVPIPDREFWRGTMALENESYRRIVLCEGDRPSAYVAVDTGSRPWTAGDSRKMYACVRELRPILLHVAFRWRLDHTPQPLSLRLLSDGPGVAVLGTHGAVLCASPVARSWLARSEELRTALSSCHGDTGSARIRGHALRWEPLDGDDSQILVRIAKHSESAPPLLELSDLTPRETELCEWLVAGKSNARIAAAMGIRPSTVKTMLERLYWKRGVAGRVELAASLMR